MYLTPINGTMKLDLCMKSEIKQRSLISYSKKCGFTARRGGGKREENSFNSATPASTHFPTPSACGLSSSTFILLKFILCSAEILSRIRSDWNDTYVMLMCV